MRKSRQVLLIFSLSVILFSLAVAGVQAQSGDNNVESEFAEGELHCTIGGLGLLLVFAALGVGFLVSGRFGRVSNFKPLPLHKVVAIVIAAFFTVEFVYGSLVRNVFFTRSMHGMLGFSVTAVALFTAGLNPLFLRRAVKWRIASKLHLVFAGVLFILLVTHLAYAFSLFD